LRIHLVRHSRPLIATGVCYGRLDVPIDPTALADMAELAAAEALESSKRVWTSPAQRCEILADAIARNLSIPKIIDSRLLELDFGTWEGKSWDDVPRADLDDWAINPATFRAHGGESGDQILSRVTSFFRDVQCVGEDCAIVSHGGPLKILDALFRGRPVDLLAQPQPVGSIVTIGTTAKAPAPPAGS
jgi:alpha-ribazole phosphatase